MYIFNDIDDVFEIAVFMHSRLFESTALHILYIRLKCSSDNEKFVSRITLGKSL